ncbi:MAG TPA: hypothetical protein VN517_02125 [Terriglobales bacterium]|nr:hypothetical protein [Terriglobales bacterium]
MSSYLIQEDQPQARQFPWKAVEREERKELPWQPAQKLRLLSPWWATVAAHSAAPDVFAHGHHGDGGVADASGPKARLKGQYSPVIQAEPMAPDSNPVQFPQQAAQQLFHDAEDAGPLPVRLQNKPAARALARRPLPLQTFYVVSACLASIYACVAL